MKDKKEDRVMWKCEFYDTENLDGYFSGVLYLYVDNKRYILSFGYDIEFGTLKLMNCNDLLYNSYKVIYSNEEIADIYTENYYLLINEIKQKIKIN